jgi:hypothetical protein
MLLNIKKFSLSLPNAQMLKAWEGELYLFSKDDDYRNKLVAKEHFPLLYPAFSLSGWGF